MHPSHRIISDLVPIRALIPCRLRFGSFPFLFSYFNRLQETQEPFQPFLNLRLAGAEGIGIPRRFSQPAPFILQLAHPSTESLVLRYQSAHSSFDLSEPGTQLFHHASARCPVRDSDPFLICTTASSPWLTPRGPPEPAAAAVIQGPSCRRSAGTPRSS